MATAVLPVADDQLPLPAADRDHRVDGFEACGDSIEAACQVKHLAQHAAVDATDVRNAVSDREQVASLGAVEAAWSEPIRS